MQNHICKSKRHSRFINTLDITTLHLSSTAILKTWLVNSFWMFSLPRISQETRLSYHPCIHVLYLGCPTDISIQAVHKSCISTQLQSIHLPLLQASWNVHEIETVYLLGTRSNWLRSQVVCIYNRTGRELQPHLNVVGAYVTCPLKVKTLSFPCSQLTRFPWYWKVSTTLYWLYPSISIFSVGTNVSITSI